MNAIIAGTAFGSTILFWICHACIKMVLPFQRKRAKVRRERRTVLAEYRQAARGMPSGGEKYIMNQMEYWENQQRYLENLRINEIWSNLGTNMFFLPVGALVIACAVWGLAPSVTWKLTFAGSAMGSMVYFLLGFVVMGIFQHIHRSIIDKRETEYIYLRKSS